MSYQTAPLNRSIIPLALLDGGETDDDMTAAAAPGPVDPNAPPPEAELGSEAFLRDVQGDIYPKFPKKVETFIFFRIKDAAEFKKNLRAFIPSISTAESILKLLREIPIAKKSGKARVPSQLFNIGFSAKAFTLLGITGDLKDPNLSQGQLAQAISVLGDRRGADGTVDWEPEWKQDIHGVLAIASSTLENLAQAEQHARSTLSSIEVVTAVQGEALPEKREHFGYVDGISQPAMEGLVLPHPGQPTCAPGLMLMGHRGDVTQGRPDWALNGSVMVFRKLKQLVPEFDKYLEDHPLELPGLSPEQGSALMGAKMFGRWKSGAPIDLYPEHDDPAVGANERQNNRFNYQRPTNGETRCPYAAHIRKMAPRVLDPEVLDPEKLKTGMILRAGIPYGPTVDEMERETKQTVKDRGLAFAAYQSTLAPGFIRLQKGWANDENFPKVLPQVQPGPDRPAGLDPIIGNSLINPGQRGATGMDPRALSERTVFPLFVDARGGEYFFMPSMRALNMIATNQPLANSVQA